MEDAATFGYGIEQATERLALTTEELSALDDLGGIVGEDGSTHPAVKPNTGDTALDHLIMVGHRQGFVDLTDIINVVDDPVAESERIEDIGRALYRAGIEIRDGDEIIDMEEVEYEDEVYDEGSAMLDTGDAANEEATIAPLSLEELGLTDEEISSLGLGDTDSKLDDVLDTPSFDTSSQTPEPEPEIVPLSLAELGLSPEEIAMLGIETATQPSSLPADIPEERAAPEEAPALPEPEPEPEITPLSLEELGLTPEEIALLGLDTGVSSAATAAPSPVAVSLPEESEPARVVEPEPEPEITPLSLEELGLTPEDIALLGLDTGVSSSPTAPAPVPEESRVPSPVQPAPVSAEPEIAPLSLEELGLSPEEIAMFGLGDTDEPAPEPAREEPAAEHIPTFTLEELGLTEKEVALLGMAAATTPTRDTSLEPAHKDKSDDFFDFDTLEETITSAAPVQRRTRPRVEEKEEEPAPLSPEDLAFVPEPLEALDDIWDQPDIQSAEAPARITLEPRPSPSQTDEAERRERPPRDRPPIRDIRSRKPRHTFRDRPERELHKEGRAPHKTGEPSEERPVFLPTGNETLDDYLHQMEAEPENYGLCLAVAHFAMETGYHDIAISHYKRVIEAGKMLEQVIDELREQMKGQEDKALLHRFYRLVGDAYIKQKRFSEAMAAYSGKFGS